jgi:heterotetrameric sarcosine oxidase gamma subunit
VAETVLTAQSPLGGISEDFDGLSIAEATGMAIVSLEAFGRAVKAAYGIVPPAVGPAGKDNARFICLARDQFFLLFDDTGTDPVATVSQRLSGTAYLTDQSDGWALLGISGPRSRAAMERICPLDLHPAIFAIGAAARTVMEHLNVIVLREAEDRFLLMSPRSSSGSFLHAVRTSAENVVPASE